MNILYLIATPNIYGGTPKKLLDMVRHSHNKCVVYFWSDAYEEKQALFREAGAVTYTGAFGRNVLRHVLMIADIVDKHSIDIVQTQFSFGEVLGYFIKRLKPKVKVIVAFVGPFKPPPAKRIILKFIYSHIDAFIYISEYVRKEKIAAFPILKNRLGRVIFNGTSPLICSNHLAKLSDCYKIVAVSFLIGHKNMGTLIRAMSLIVHNMNQQNIELYILGDGPEYKNLSNLIKTLQLKKHILLMGNRNDVGDFLHQSDLFVHPAVAEGFGIAVAEAMMAGLPVIAANAGALPELIVDGESGLLVDPLDSQKWADAIVKLMTDPELAQKLAANGKKRAMKMFSIERFIEEYDKMYKRVLESECR